MVIISAPFSNKFRDKDKEFMAIFCSGFLRKKMQPTVMPYRKEKYPLPSPSRLSKNDPFYDEIIWRHEEACGKGLSTYEDPKTKLKVFTAAYHLKRGACCGSGCRHCPFV